MSGDNHWMQIALAEARRGIGLTSPNPVVGAVIVQNGRLVSVGHHAKAGRPHAEIVALESATESVTGSTMYITLEPCSTQGRTPPCIAALIKAGLSRVVWSVKDPNPQHAGRAETILKAAGLEVSTEVLLAECTELIRPWAHYMRTGLPWVTAKSGVSLDGRITRPVGEGQWLTGAEARADAMHLRTAADAIMVGAETIRMDDPALTVRGSDVPTGKIQPLRVVMTRSGDLPVLSRIFQDEHKDRTLVVRNESITGALRLLAARGVVHVLLEGGGRLLASAFSEGVVNEVVFYMAPLISGTGAPVVHAENFNGGSVALTIFSTEMIGPDLKITARPR